VHGVLHALGHDHPEGTGRTQSPMWRRQEALVRRFMSRAGQRGRRRAA
jgi:probable rRNA maturation factor